MLRVESCTHVTNLSSTQRIRSHPELAVAKKLTSESKSEQASAKLNECSDEEYDEFKKLNIEYKKKFNFPFIIAVKGKNKNEILNYFRERINNSLNEVCPARFIVFGDSNLFIKTSHAFFSDFVPVRIIPISLL